MSVNKLGITVFSGFLMFSTGLVARAQSTTPAQDQKSKSQATQTEKSTRTTASSEDIKKVQQTLKDQGMYTGSVDGTMNAETKKALRDYQQKNNLKVTGTLDHETMAALGVTHQGTKGTTTSKEGTAPRKAKGPKATSSYSKEDVREMQTALKQQGFDPGPVDGIKGPLTITAIRNFQSHTGMPVTGELDAATRSALTSGTASASVREKGFPSTETQTQQPYSTQPSNVASSENIRRAQQHLADLMYNPGDANGMMTSQTTQAIREFQWLNNLPVTGNLDDQTMMAIENQWSGTSSPLSQTYSTSPGYSTSAELENPSVVREKPAPEPQYQSSTQTTESSTYAQNTGTYGGSTAAGTQTKSETKAEKKHHEKQTSGKTDKDISERATKAADVLTSLTAASDKKIPNELLEHAEAIAVIPNMIKGAFGIGGR